MSYKIEKEEQVKHEFIASISHELRTTLIGSKEWSETIKSVKCLTEKEIEQGMGTVILIKLPKNNKTSGRYSVRYR
ncbi:putative sensor histidine kinase [Bacillus clarus]|uniref:histidine kinase n=1 Tax=Bacillus clarus TaxID=2338372 RepID=A0A090YAD4_9BACI|nr:putative sensor histidine kinase [Bacillus clarus]